MRRMVTYGLVMVVALGAVVVNALDFARIDGHTVLNWRALDAMAADESPLVRIGAARRRYELFLAIEQAAPRAVVTGPCRQGVPSFRHRLFGIAGVVQASADRRLDSDALLADLDLSDHVVHRQEREVDALVAVETFGAPGVHLVILCPSTGVPAEVVIVDAQLLVDRLPEGR